MHSLESDISIWALSLVNENQIVLCNKFVSDAFGWFFHFVITNRLLVVDQSILRYVYTVVLPQTTLANLCVHA